MSNSKNRSSNRMASNYDGESVRTMVMFQTTATLVYILTIEALGYQAPVAGCFRGLREGVRCQTKGTVFVMFGSNIT